MLTRTCATQLDGVFQRRRGNPERLAGCVQHAGAKGVGTRRDPGDDVALRFVCHVGGMGRQTANVTTGHWVDKNTHATAGFRPGRLDF